MDGLLDVYWEGDEVIWRSFIRHYCLCLMQAFGYVACKMDDEIFDASCINTRATPELLSPEGQIFLEYLTDTLMKDTVIARLLEALVNGGKVHKAELGSYFIIYHKFILRTLQNVEKIFYGGKSILFLEDFTNDDFALDSQDLDAFIKTATTFNNSDRHIASDISNKIMEEVSLLARYNFFSNENCSAFRKNIATLFTWFPNIYLDALVASAYDEYYLASFSEKPENITMWGHYAQGHKGVCLVFNFNQDVHGYFLETENGEKLYLHKVKYHNDPPRINLFECIGYLSRANLDKYWLTHNGKVSNVSVAYEDDYHKKCWENFRKKISHKFKSWEREDEHRIAKDAWFIGRQSKEQRLITYKKNHLVGIIFGFQTNENIKFKIMDYLDRSLDAESKKTFKLYQARYSGAIAKLEIEELSLLNLS